MIAAMTMPAEKSMPAYKRLLAGEPATQWESLAGELKELIAVEAGAVGKTVSTSLSQASMLGLLDSFAASQSGTAQAAAKPGGNVEEPVALTG
jgi:hypothetical protein